MFKVEDLSLENNYLSIKLKSTKALDKLKVEFRLKDMTRYAVSAYNQYFETSIHSIDENTHEIKVELSIFTDRFEMKNLTKQLVWIYINHNGEFLQLKLDKELKEKVKKLGSTHLCSLADIKFSESNNSLCLSINKINTSCTLSKMSLEGDRLVLEMSPVMYQNEHLSLANVQLKKRIFKDLLIYSHSVTLNHTNEHTYTLDQKALNTIEFDKVNNLDFMAEIRDQNVSIAIPVLIKEPVNLPDISFNKNLNSKLYVTAKKSLSVRVEKQNSLLEVLDYAVSNQAVNLEINLQTLEKMNVEGLRGGLFRETISINDRELTLYKNLKININKTIANVIFNFNDLSEEFDSNYSQTYVIALYDSTDPSMIPIHLTSGNKIEHKEKTKKSAIVFTVNKEAKFTVTPNTPSPIRLSLLGSCFSRAAFNSSNSFFNHDYKFYYSVEYSHFWISLISAASEKIPFDRTTFADVPDKVIYNIQKEYEKTTFDDLKSVASDYIIIDFFVDAVHGVRRLPDGRFIGQNGDLHKSYYYKHHYLKETSQFDFRHPDFWETWKKSCDIFIERLREIINPNKLILNLGGLSDSFYNENKEVSSFSKEKKFTSTEINFINHTWEKMNNYFISKVPTAKILDLSQYNYLASLDYPYGGSGPHHYERNYYKTFLGELSKIVLMDKIQ